MAKAVAWDLHYDRRVSEDFLAHFLKGGVASSLVDYVKHAPYPLDLQMRSNPKRKLDEHATLYAGLTSILNVDRKGDRLSLSVADRWKTGGYGFSEAWTKAMDVDDLGAGWRAVENYLEAVIPDATREHASREGAVQAAASVFTGNHRVMIDREAALHFKNEDTKARVFADIKQTLLPAIGGVSGVPGTPTYGGECDLLALDTDGRLLAVEVKPRGTGSIAWSALQATIYAMLLQRWVESPRWGTDADSPAAVLNGMLDQRARLKLASKQGFQLTADPVVVPVVAVQRGANAKYMERMNTVRAALIDGGFAAVEVYEVSMAGQLDPLA